MNAVSRSSRRLKTDNQKGRNLVTSIRPHVIIEGPDGAGKTTLAEHLVKHHGYRYHHEGKPEHVDMLVRYAEVFLEQTASGQPVVFDRLHLGELVYGNILRGKDRMHGSYGLELLELLFQAKGVA